MLWHLPSCQRACSACKNRTPMLLPEASQPFEDVVEWLDMCGVNPLRYYLEYLHPDPDSSESTKASVLSAVRGVFRFACTHYGLAVNPARYISAPKLQKRVPHVVAADDITAAMKAAPKRMQLAIMLMHLCGLRVTECLSLTIEDFKENRIIVRGKGKKDEE